MEKLLLLHKMVTINKSDADINSVQMLCFHKYSTQTKTAGGVSCRQKGDFVKPIVFTVPGPPQGKARARTVINKNTGRSMSYTPDKTVLYENWIRDLYLQSNSCLFNNKEMLAVRVLAYFAIPISTSKAKREAMLSGEIRPLKKPDGDNILKAVCDALNGVAYGDDSQIVDKAVHKWYSEQPRIEVAITNYSDVR